MLLIGSLLIGCRRQWHIIISIVLVLFGVRVRCHWWLIFQAAATWLIYMCKDFDSVLAFSSPFSHRPFPSRCKVHGSLAAETLLYHCWLTCWELWTNQQQVSSSEYLLWLLSFIDLTTKLNYIKSQNYNGWLVLKWTFQKLLAKQLELSLEIQQDAHECLVKVFELCGKVSLYFLLEIC